MLDTVDGLGTGAPAAGGPSQLQGVTRIPPYDRQDKLRFDTALSGEICDDCGSPAERTPLRGIIGPSTGAEDVPGAQGPADRTERTERIERIERLAAAHAAYPAESGDAASAVDAIRAAHPVRPADASGGTPPAEVAYPSDLAEAAEAADPAWPVRLRDRPAQDTTLVEPAAWRPLLQSSNPTPEGLAAHELPAHELRSLLADSVSRLLASDPLSVQRQVRFELRGETFPGVWITLQEVGGRIEVNLDCPTAAMHGQLSTLVRREADWVARRCRREVMLRVNRIGDGTEESDEPGSAPFEVWGRA